GEFCSGAIDQIKSAALGIENARRPFDDQTMQIGRANRFAESFAKTVQKIEDQRFLDLHFFLGTFQAPNAAPLSQQRENPQAKAAEEQPEENSWRERGQLLHRCRLMSVLF